MMELGFGENAELATPVHRPHHDQKGGYVV